MAAIARQNWARGWVPSGDFVNGPKDGLARMDNLQLDEDGALTLVPGITDIYDFSSWPHTIFSKFIGNNKFRYTINANGDITRNGGVFYTGADSLRGSFAVHRGYILICSGNVRIKDDTVNTYNLGIIRPDGTPSIEVASQSRTELTALGVSTSFDTDGSFVATAEPTLLTPDSTVANSEAPLGGDGIVLNVRVGDTSKLIKARLQFNLDASSGESDYFYFEWGNDIGGQFKGGTNAWSTLSANRSSFTKVGESTKGWTEINSIKFQLFFTDTVATNLVNEIHVVGGEQGPLTEAYDYCQVYVTNDGKYIGKSPEGPSSGAVWVSHGYTLITPHSSNATSDVNEVWIYRRSTREAGAHRPFDAIQQLPIWYRVAVVPAPFNTIEDRMSDEEALRQETLKPGLINVQSIVEPIVGIVGEYNSRVLYLTSNSLYLSEIDNPDLVDPVNSFSFSGATVSRNLWIKATDSGRLLVGTTQDIFEVTGTLVDFPDGSVDIIIRRLGVSHPPITRETSTYQGAIFYLSSAGIVQLIGSNSLVISDQLQQLFDGNERYGIAPVRLVGNDLQTSPLCVAKNKLFTALELTDGTRWCFIFDLVKKYWIAYFTDPNSFFCEEDGRLLAGYNSPAPALREIYTYDDTTFARDVVFQTFHDDDNLPRNRKDVFTLKITADTGGDPVDVSVAKNGSVQYYTVMNDVTFTGREEKFITIAETTGLGLGKTFSVKIQGQSLSTFKLYNFSIEYLPRPEQLTYLRLNYSNLGTASRKRFVNFPVEIDTLSVDCEFVPIIDGVVYPSSLINFGRKGTHIHYFDTEAVGTDIAAIICGFFEFYTARYDEMISEKMPNPVTYLRIPQTDYGTPNRKRHSSYKFRINTRGATVRLTPRLDGVNQTSFDFSTTEPTVVEYLFTTASNSDPIAINIGGELQSTTSPKTPFEFYDVIKPQIIEELPPRLKEFRIPETNYGVASKKRIRVIPYEINTNGSDVTFTPIIDNVVGTPSVVNTSTRNTVYHYFDTDVFCTDICGRLDGDEPFEFYGLMKPEVVETLPVPTRFTQIGPLRFDKLAKFQALRVRTITTNGPIPFKIIIENEATLPSSAASFGEHIGIIPAITNRDDVYEITLPKTVNGTIFRIEFGPNALPFYMYDVQIKHVLSGMQADPKWIKAFSWKPNA